MSAKIVNKLEDKKAFKIPGIPDGVMASLAMKVVGFDKLNEIYSHICQYKGADFADHLIDYLGIRLNCNTDLLADIPKEGKLIIVSNHPFGGIDGMIALSVLSKVRPDIKIFTHYILASVENIKEQCIASNTTYGFGRIVRNSIVGLRQAEEYVESGGALVMFPAGDVSSYAIRNRNTEGMSVQDAQWQLSMVRMIKRCNTAVIPIYFHGENSWYFNFLNLISPKLASWRLAGEVTNKAGQELFMRIGAPVKAVELAKFSDDRLLARFLRSRSYVLETDCIEGGAESIKTPDTDKSAHEEQVAKYSTPLIPPVDTELLLAEINANPENKLFSIDSRSCYLFDYKDIPNLMREIGLRREEAFRDVGEGTNKEIDTDDFDVYYKHLVLWDHSSNSLVGAYRLGFGRDILRLKGIHGFYTDTLFRLKDEFASVMSQSIELGRSFVSLKYQKDTLALLLLLKGLFYVVFKYENYKYLIGPVSISSWYPMLYRSLMVKYLRAFHSEPAYTAQVNPKTPFIPDFGRVDADALLYSRMDTLEGFDRYLFRLSGGRYRLPTLLKKYLKLGAQIIEYNVDPDFNYCLDGLILLNIENVPTDDLDSLSKEFEDRNVVYKRFYGSSY